MRCIKLCKRLTCCITDLAPTRENVLCIITTLAKWELLRHYTLNESWLSNTMLQCFMGGFRTGRTRHALMMYEQPRMRQYPSTAFYDRFYEVMTIDDICSLISFYDLARTRLELTLIKRTLVPSKPASQAMFRCQSLWIDGIAVHTEELLSVQHPTVAFVLIKLPTAG